MREGERLKRKRLGSTSLSSLFEPYVWEWFEEAFGEPSPPQAASWPKIAKAKNTLIFSPTGSGKTLAAFLWCLNELFRMGSKGELLDSIYVLYVSPLKALNNDIQKNLVEPLKGIREHAQRMGIDVPDVRSLVRTGDTTTKERAEMARHPPHVLITTPESLFIILSTQKFREALRTVRYVIVDEIHAMSDNKRGVHLSLSLERLQRLVKGDIVRIGLSATQRPLDEIARFLVGMGDANEPRECEIVDVGARKDLNVKVVSPVDNLVETHFDAIWGSAYDKLISMIREHGTTLIFTNSRYKTERIALRLNELSADEPVAVGAHHGSMSKGTRLQMEDMLKNGKLDALVATSSLELGIDVGSIDLVCQIQSPKSVSKGVQRIGRAGHLLDATSEGRLFVMDRDDLVESAVLVKAIIDGQIDTTHIPMNCFDVLAQHVVGAVAADDWNVDDLFDLCRRSYCYRELKRGDFEKVLEMLSGNYAFVVDQPPYPKILWDRVNDMLSPVRGARLIVFRSSGTIPDVADYDVYFEKRETKVGQLDEGFVEELRVGDVFILGSSSWRVIGIRRNRVIVEDVYGQAPTIPFWMGERDSRTFDLAMSVGHFRREMETQIEKGDEIGWLKKGYRLDDNCAEAISEYFREQKQITHELPSDKLVVIEHFNDELGHQQIAVHSSFGIRVNDTWAMVLCQAIEEVYGFRPQDATVDDGILITMPKDRSVDPEHLLDLVTIDNIDRLLDTSIPNSPVFSSRFRHNAVRALLVLREYRGRRTPVWLQNLRASDLLAACLNHRDFPLIAETFRECANEAFDVPNLRVVLGGLKSGEISARTLSTKIPSPFLHSLLLLGQYGEIGSIPARERRTRLVHLRRELLRQILDEETLSNLLDQKAVEEVDAKLQHTHPLRRARNSNELARALLELGGLVEAVGEDISLIDRTDGEAHVMLSELISAHRAILAPIPTAESNRERWISTEDFPLYRAAFGVEVQLDSADGQILRSLEGKRSLPIPKIRHATEQRIEKLLSGYAVLRVLEEGKAGYVAASSWIPKHIREKKIHRQEARMALIEKFVKSHGPITKYEIMECYGFSDQFVERTLGNLQEAGSLVKGEYVPTKPFPQWCYKSHLEEIHRLTLNRLRKEMEPATPVEYADLLARLQHVHPNTQLSGIDGLREVIEQIQGYEDYQVIFERHIFPTRLKDYDTSMLDRLCYSGEVYWRRFDYNGMRRGRIGFCFRKDRDWIVANPNEVPMDLKKWDEDIGGACDAVRGFIAKKGACFFGDIVEGTGIDRNLVLRAIWHLVWTGEATNDSYESIRHANISSGLSGCYDLATKPRKRGVTIDLIVRHMLKNHKLDPTLGRWVPTERLVPAVVRALDPGERALRWASLLLKRYGVVSRESLEREVGVPEWKDVRRALVKLELLGKVRRGFFVQELSGEQYAYPETIDALRDIKVRHPDLADELFVKSAQDADEPMMLLNACDLANPFTYLFPVTNEVGEEVKFMRTANKFLVIEAGQPVLLYEMQMYGSIKLLTDMLKDKAEKAVRTLMQLTDKPSAVGTYREIHVSDWNGNPIDVSPARHLLAKLGFVDSGIGWKGYVYDGTEPDGKVVARAERQLPDIFERAGKEKAPVKYDAVWIVSRSPKDVRQKVRELIALLPKILPKGCEIAYYPRNFAVLYRGVKCISPYVQRKRIWLQITYKGWTRGLPIETDTDLSAPDFVSKILVRFGETKRQIDLLLGPHGPDSSLMR